MGSRALGQALTLVLAVAAGGAASAGACREDAVWLRGEWGEARFSVELADDPQERAQGLMFRENLPESAGMLFVYERPQPVAFWMENTLIPLDMIFVDVSGTVRRVHTNAVPGDRTPIPGGREIFAVLEINGGKAEAMGIAPGTEMRHPAFGTAAAWPCE